MGHTGVSVRDRTVTKTCIKLPVVTAWDISSDSPLHWIPCHSSLNGQTDEFMHNWDLYYEKENEGSVSSLAVSGGMKEAGRDSSGEGKRERQPLPPSVQRTRWARRRTRTWRKWGWYLGGGGWLRQPGPGGAFLDLPIEPSYTLSPLAISTEAGLQWALGTVSELIPLVYSEN